MEIARFTLLSELRAIFTRLGARMTESIVTAPRSDTDRVNSRRINASPWSGSSFSARTSTGTTSEVSTAPSTISVIILGS